ncbi:MAG TPA: hypothetical protein VMF65_00035 [Acidimicrobiales bacterium]|nr:hypothetical protein [Acidimicrobiales bacterium]
MALSPELLSALDVALNEAELHHLRVRTDIAQAVIDLVVLTLPVVGPEPDLEGRIVSLNLWDVGRVVASLREGRWDDEMAPVTRFELSDLDSVVGDFGVKPIYGWQFFDAPATTWRRLGRCISLDVTIPSGARAHTLDLFQESGAGPSRHLDIRLWFGRLGAFSHDRRELDLEEVAAGGRRWWDALYAGDPRTEGHGIVPAGAPRNPST